MDVDSERVVWVRVYGVPCHVWGTDFFETLANQLGSFICVDDNIVSGDNMDIARVMIRVAFNFVLNNFMEVAIDGEVFNLVFREDTYGLVRIAAKKVSSPNRSYNSSSNSDVVSKAENHGSGEEEDDDYVDTSYPSDNEVEIRDRKSDGVGQILHESNGREAGASFDKAIQNIFEKKRTDLDIVSHVPESSSDRTFSGLPVSKDKAFPFSVQGGATCFAHGGVSLRAVSILSPQGKLTKGPNCLFRGGEEVIEGPTQVFPQKCFPTFSLLSSSSRGNSGIGFIDNIPGDSDIVRCNIRTLSNFDNSCDEKLSDAISKLGVIPGQKKKEVHNFFPESHSLEPVWMEEVTDVIASSLWGLNDVDFSYSSSEGGDLNAVKKRSERIGHSIRSSNVEWKDFSDFIVESGLVDVPCKGKKFTWFSGDGKLKSRIDRFLVSNNIISKWGVVGQWIGSRDVSDHCPVWLLVDKEDWGPKPFKVNNEWFSHKSFFSFVEEEWKSLYVQGRGDFVLKEKFSLIKDRLKWWEKNIFGNIDLDVEEGVRVLNDSDDSEYWGGGGSLKYDQSLKEYLV
ncbi:uncharacterized protein LOC131618913 [Vicia villosa]|uniref:uncharacterized protein LOC131618913 n=1 Tax=Vicia villosa TaxID=3911 RepID=UPI00273C1A56|nr:uncharacterized protein LOC131618913 [Vicia villosa]